MKNLKVVKVWGTLDANRELPYVNIYNSEAEAKEEIGSVVDGLEIDGVVQGWCVVANSDVDVDLEDFHFTYDEAVDEKNAILFG